MRLFHETVLILLVSAAALGAQQPDHVPDPPKPLPDISTLMHQVENNQRAEEVAAKDYLYRAIVRAEEIDGQGSVRKVTTTESDIFWIDGVPCRRLMKKNGKDISPEDQKKENERIDKEVAKAKERRAKNDAKGEETDPRGDQEVPLSRILELGAFTNERRVTLGGRDTIAVDFTGDPKARTRNRTEGLLHDTVGTVWVDEQDKDLTQIEAHIAKDFKIAGGLVADLHQGSSMSLRRTKVNGEAWLPASFEGHGQVRVLLFGGFHGNIEAKFTDYRRFKATSTILPAQTQTESSAP